MKILNKFLLLAMLSVVFACNSDDDTELAGQEYKPTLTITPSVTSGNVNEGTSATYSISYDKPINHPISLKATLVSGVAGESDLELGVTTIPANATSGSITVTFIDDLIPEVNESAVIKIEGASEDSSYYINPASQLSSYSYTIVSPLNPTDLVVALEWDYDSAPDIDLYAFSDVNGAWDAAATADTPEVGNLVMGADPDGTYFLGIDPYEIEDGVTSFDYNFTFGNPDGSISNISGTYDYENQDTTYDILSYQGTFVYLLVKVEKTGTSYVVTQL